MQGRVESKCATGFYRGGWTDEFLWTTSRRADGLASDIVSAIGKYDTEQDCPPALSYHGDLWLGRKCSTRYDTVVLLSYWRFTHIQET